MNEVIQVIRENKMAPFAKHALLVPLYKNS